MKVEWDKRKDKSNQLKHGIAFADAAKLFAGQDYLEIYDGDHSDEEERFIAIGPIRRGVVVVVWTERVEGILRIISAHWASKKETRLYRNYMEMK